MQLIEDQVYVVLQILEEKSNMDNSIIVAMITGGVTLTVNLIANWTARKKDAVANAVRDQKIEDSINELTKRVDEHNGVMDKVTNIEKSIVRIETKMETFHK